VATEHKGSDVKSVARSDGKTSNFFGGEGKADGPGHGHIDLDSKGNETFRREPGEKKK
jgi:hypothetical protein